MMLHIFETGHSLPPALFVLVWMWVGMFVALRTGELFDASTAGFAMVAAAVLPQDDSPPQVARQPGELFR